MTTLEDREFVERCKRDLLMHGLISGGTAEQLIDLAMRGVEGAEALRVAVEALEALSIYNDDDNAIVNAALAQIKATEGGE